MQIRVYFLLFLFSLGSVWAQDDTTGKPPQRATTLPTSTPVAQATRVDTAPALDGEVLDDEAWSTAVPITSFWQSRPDEFDPATERTEVRIMYTATTLYFGVVCYDRTPEGIIVSESRRDSPLDDTDSFQIIIDTYLDRQNGFVFGTNPNGIEYDGQVANEGEGGGFGRGRQQAGSGGGFNRNWDGSWEVQAKVSEIGWSAEFAIPFRTVRFPRADVQSWGLNFQRNIRRRNEIAFWAPLSRQFNLYRLSEAGRVEGLEIPGQRNLQLIPYVLGNARKQSPRDETIYTGDVGGDVKYSITPSLTLDGTINTDFAQVEVDEQQINLDRFNLFFPEKRPFFLENAGQFSVGNSGEVELFFSRRIGISDDGAPIPIIGGARVSGKLANMNVGFLNMQTDSLAGVQPSDNFTVARVSKELPNRSSIGGIFVNRVSTGDLALEGDHNQTFGLDGKWGIGRYGELKGYLAGTSTPSLDGGEYAGSIEANYDSSRWRLGTSYTQLGENFNPEVGFLSRTGGYRKFVGSALYRYQPDFGGFFEWRPHVTYRAFWDLEGFQTTGYLHLDQHWEWRNGWEVHTGVNFTREGLKDGFTIYPGDPDLDGDDVVVDPGTYDHAEGALVLMTDEGAWLSFNARTTFGGFFGGDRFNFAPGFRMRLGELFDADFSYTYNNIDLPNGAFTTNLGRLRLSYSFTPRIFLQALLQYNDRADIWSTNVRFGWLQTSNIGLFVVYNDTRGLNQYLLPTGEVPDQSLTIKFSRLFNVLN